MTEKFEKEELFSKIKEEFQQVSDLSPAYFTFMEDLLKGDATATSQTTLNTLKHEVILMKSLFYGDFSTEDKSIEDMCILFEKVVVLKVIMQTSLSHKDDT